MIGSLDPSDRPRKMYISDENYYFRLKEQSMPTVAKTAIGNLDEKVDIRRLSTNVRNRDLCDTKVMICTILQLIIVHEIQY